MRKQVSPKVTIVIILLTLLVVQFVYWRKLVYTPRGRAPGMSGGMMLTQSGPAIPLGLESVRVTTYAGDATPGYKDGDRVLARFNGPSALAADKAGNLFVSDSRNHRIRRISPQGKVSTVAGSGEAGALMGGFADGPANKAQFWNPSGLAAHPQKGLYIADTGNHRVRLLTPQGEVKTIAGGDTPRDALGRPVGGYADGLSEQARFRFPTGLALDGAGNLYVADTGNQCVRKITPDGANASRSTVTTLARFSTVKPKIFVARLDIKQPAGNAPPPSPAEETSAPSGNIATPTSIVADPTGTLIVADSGNQCLWEVAPGGATRLFVPPPQTDMEARDASHFLRPTGLAADSDGSLYVTDTLTHCLLHWNRQNGITLLAGQFYPTPFGHYTDEAGNRARFATPSAVAVRGKDVFVADFGNNCIRQASGIDLSNVPRPNARFRDVIEGMEDVVRGAGRFNRNRFAPEFP